MAWLKSRRLAYLAALIASFFCLFAILRGIFYFGFSEVGDTVQTETATLLETLYIGLKFDLRLAILVSLPVLVLSFFKFNITNTTWVRRLNHVYIGVAVVFLLLLYIMDFGNYAYLGTRVDSTILRFFNDIYISANMMWESYPVVWILLAWFAASVVFMLWVFRLTQWLLNRPSVSVSKKQIATGSVVVAVLLGTGMFGQLGTLVPLRWNHAFFSGNVAVAALGLNPVLFFSDSFAYRNAGTYKKEQVEKYYDVMAEYLGVENPDPATFNYTRTYPANPDGLGASDRPPNIVIIMLESLGASRLGMHGNPLKPSPNLDKIAEEGWFFKRFYVPVSGTARTVWATVTSLPDVSTERTASRNPAITEQHSLINAFRGYEKIYSIGGSAGWAHIGGIWRVNVNDLKIYQEGYWEAPTVDVWGISDLNLFKETDKIFRAIPKEKPFFAFVQTAANHRPFTIPENNDGFETIDVPEEDLKKWGYRNVEQFNAVRLLDFNIGKFMDMAKAGGYFDNTIFVMYGDHNNRITTTPHMPKFNEPLDLDGLHVPAMIYAPKLLGRRVIEDAVSLVDVMPTLAGILGVEYVNASMGRDIALPVPGGERFVFTLTSQVGNPVIGAISKDYMLRMNHDGSDAKLHDLNSDVPAEDVSALLPEKAAYLTKLTRGIYETGKWMFYHNKHLPGDGNK